MGSTYPHAKGQFWGGWGIPLESGTLCSHLCKNGWTNRDAIWVEDLGRPKEACIWWCWIHHAKGQLLGKGTCPGMRRHFAVSCAKIAELIDLPFGLGTQVSRRKHKFNCICQVAPMCLHGSAHWRLPANYGWTAHLCRRCSLMSNYFDHFLMLL